MRKDTDVLARALGEQIQMSLAIPWLLARLGVAVLIVSALVAIPMTQNALAGTYTINDCPAAGGSTDAGPLIASGGSQGAKGSCGEGEGDWIGPRGVSMAPDSVAFVSVSAPGASTIHGAKVWWYVPRSSSGASTFALVAVNAGTIAESQTPLERRGTPSEFTLPSGTTTLTLADYCANDDAGYGCSFGDSGAANLEVFGAQLTVEENRPPSGSATGGGLISHEPLSGNQSIGFATSDADSGIRRVQLLVDGKPVAQEDYGTTCSYTHFSPCPASESGSIWWDTSALADGRHGIELVAVDAANNASVLYTGNFSTNNAPPNEREPTNGSSPEAGAAVSLSPGAEPSPPTAPASAPDSAGNALMAKLHLNGPSSITRDFAHRALRIAGQLTGMNGQSIAGVSLQVLQQPLGGALRAVDGVVTGSNGSFTAEVPPGASRLIEVRLAPGSPYYAAAARVRETVRAGVVLKITPRQTGATGTIVLGGRVEGAIPKAGVIVNLLVHYHGRWVPFRTPRTDATGHFEAEYSFQGSVGRWPFRAQVPRGQEGLPYASGLSRVLVVRTR